MSSRSTVARGGRGAENGRSVKPALCPVYGPTNSPVIHNSGGTHANVPFTAPRRYVVLPHPRIYERAVQAKTARHRVCAHSGLPFPAHFLISRLGARATRTAL